MKTLLRRGGLVTLSLLNLWWGGWALLAPRDFFGAFPGFGHHWTAAYPPFNEHLVVDLGTTMVTLAVLTGLAALVDDARVTRVVMAGVIVFSALHLAFHAHTRGTMLAGDYAASIVALVAGVIAPAVLLVMASGDDKL